MQLSEETIEEQLSKPRTQLKTPVETAVVLTLYFIMPAKPIDPFIRLLSSVCYFFLILGFSPFIYLERYAHLKRWKAHFLRPLGFFYLSRAPYRCDEKQDNFGLPMSRPENSIPVFFLFFHV